MKLFATLAALVATASAVSIHETLQIIREVNSAKAGWTAGINKGFENMTPDLERALCGAKVSAGKLREFALVANELPSNDIPTEFDSRTNWPGYIGGIRDQAQCGSCWAFGATEFVSDRFAIQSKGAIKVTLSPQDLVSCDNKTGNMGCNGGYPIRALQYIRDTGIVTDECYNYTSGTGVTGECKLTFPSGPCPSIPGQDAKFYHLKDAYEVGTTVEAIQTEIMTNGPVEATFAVYNDFFSYKSGVYRHVSGGLAGYHAVKLLGWGVEQGTGTPYWILANSWNTSWGDQGFFLMLRGSDECGIESGITAGNPKV